MYDPPVQVFAVLSQKPAPDGVLQVRTQHWMLSAPGQYPATLVPAHEDVAMQVPIPD